VSRVMLMFECPKRSCTTFGCTPAGQPLCAPHAPGYETGPRGLGGGLDSPAMPQNPTMERLALQTLDEAVSQIDEKRDHVMADLSRRLINSNQDLIEAIRNLKSASDEASRTLLRATWVLVGLTVVIVVLTCVLVLAS
jgi:hypothetical protein